MVATGSSGKRSRAAGARGTVASWGDGKQSNSMFAADGAVFTAEAIGQRKKISYCC